MEDEVTLQRTSDSIRVALPGRSSLALPRAPLPESFLQWQSQARLRVFAALTEQGADAVRMNAAHLPVMATLGADGCFPVNLACKAMSLLPRPERLENATRQFERARTQAEERSWPDTLAQRVQAARAFYSQLENVDRWTLGGLEIFTGQTARNLQRYPLAALLYTGEAPSFLSYQLTGVVELAAKGSPYYRFLRAARELFAFDAFHIPQPDYTVGYLFHVVEVRDKTPLPLGATNR